MPGGKCEGLYVYRSLVLERGIIRISSVVVFTMVTIGFVIAYMA